MNTKGERVGAILREIELQGLRWHIDAQGRRIETVRPGRWVRVGDGCESYELECLPGQRERLAEIAGELALVLGARLVRIDEPEPGRVVVVAEGGRMAVMDCARELGEVARRLEALAGQDENLAAGMMAERVAVICKSLAEMLRADLWRGLQEPGQAGEVGR